MLRRENRRSRQIQSGCAGMQITANPPAGFGPTPQGQWGAKPDMFVERTLASGAFRWRHREAGEPQVSGVLPKMQTVKSSTMKGASSPCQSAAAETEPNREEPFRTGKVPLLYSGT